MVVVVVEEVVVVVVVVVASSTEVEVEVAARQPLQPLAGKVESLQTNRKGGNKLCGRC